MTPEVPDAHESEITFVTEDGERKKYKQMSITVEAIARYFYACGCDDQMSFEHAWKDWQDKHKEWGRIWPAEEKAT